MKPPIISSPGSVATTTEDSFAIADLPNLLSSSTFDGVIGFFDSLWTYFVIFSYIVSILLLVAFVYAAIHKKELDDIFTEQIERKEKLYAEKYKGGLKKNRLQEVDEHVSSDNPNDWKLAIIEADIILDEALKELGYTGPSLGERLRNLTTNQVPSLEDAWQAHKVRNQIAHSGMDFVLTKKLAEDTIKQYRRVFNDLGLL